MTLRPKNIELASGDRVRIEWSDGQVRGYTFRQLRDGCSCATCREQRSQPPAPTSALPILSAAEAQSLKVLEMKPVGNYAYSIAFSDGHNTGIYTYERLRTLGEEIQQ